MERLNDTLFLMLNASALPTPPVFGMAVFFAQYLILTVPVAMGLLWLRADEAQRRSLIAAAMAGAIGLAVNQAIGWVWQHPRPFVVGIGHTYLAHAADSSFPSDHLTLIWSVACALMLDNRTRTAGVAAALLGLPVAWARIFLGVHYPMDMAGSVIVAGISVWLVTRHMRWLLTPVCHVALLIHRKLFAHWIDLGWVKA
ncbi:undecaprenyl-diphosphatase [Pandoraea terrigena]|uniref:Undecaprenyl-diphosphatase YbjG n=1 Tax=Pandoraea terrigena TaxID=2508292 RepID=A0A5E4RF35_9BURK|nr:undecaprenyl-diphosphatase [Pandoraea terrigena]VVD61421.1 Putative undecaprenyl-diphosphatase YbjG [Pandoraea terrigena]